MYTIYLTICPSPRTTERRTDGYHGIHGSGLGISSLVDEETLIGYSALWPGTSVPDPPHERAFSMKTNILFNGKWV